jgi:hypothetical protein
MEDDDTSDVWNISDRMVTRYHNPRHRHHVKYWLKIALPVHLPGGSAVAGVRLRVGDQVTQGWLVEDLDAIAARSLKEKQDSIMLRTAARAIFKWAVTEKAEDESEILGFFVNLFGAGTEAADTRSWVGLPQTIWMARAEVPPGTASVVLEFINAGGSVIDEHVFTDLDSSGDHPLFLSWRSFR